MTILLSQAKAFVRRVAGGGTPELVKRCKGCFLEAKPFKPDATREVSREIYIVCKKYRPPLTPNRDNSGTGSPWPGKRSSSIS
jgi:23S rRNA U2552 (ribose-2'-O)-methylase RlmE/FtsJ